MAHKRKVICIVAAIAIAVLSFTVIGNWASNADTYSGSMAALNETRADALEITAVATGAAAALALIPGDSTTPLANKLMDVAGYTVIVFTAIVFEKYLLTLTGLLAFKILIPLACLLILVGCFLQSYDRRRVMYMFAARLAILGLLLWSLVPASIKVSDCIESVYQASTEASATADSEANAAEASKSDASAAGEKSDSAKDNSGSAKGNSGSAKGNSGSAKGNSGSGAAKETESSGILDKAKQLFNSAKENVSSIAEKSTDQINAKIEEFKSVLEQLLEGLAVMIVTTCVIPICVLLLGVWLIKFIMGLAPPAVRIPKASQIIKSNRSDNSDNSDN